MRIGVISDIHSNLQALRVVLEELGKLSPDVTVCAGDIVGYGANPNECCRLAADAADLAIGGNHEAAVASGDTSRMNPYAAAAAMWTREVLDEDSWSFIGSLPLSERTGTDEGVVFVFHGSDVDSGEYVYEELVDPDILRRCSGEFVILGHTHVPFVRRFPEGIVMNPGAVGQPRDGDPRASFALLDTKARTCDVVRAEYPVGEASEAILKAELPMMLALRLSAGK